MVLESDTDRETDTGAAPTPAPSKLGRTRLARELFSGRFRPGRVLKLDAVASEYGMDRLSVRKAFAEFQAVRMITLNGNTSAIVDPPDPKPMKDAYEIRAALEEIAGRTAAASLKGGATGVLLQELKGMRAALDSGDLDACIEHDINFHRHILEASQNDLLLRVWDSLAIDLRMRAVSGKAGDDMRDVVESHQPIADALCKGRGRQAGLLLRNHVETFSEYIRKSGPDSGFQPAMQRDLEGAKDVQQAFFPSATLSIPCLSCETFYQPANQIGGDYYDLLPLHGGKWGIAIGDVSGKGIGAALVMAGLRASLRAQALHPHVDLSALISDVNRLVHESSPTHFYATLFYAEYEPAKRILRYVNAGHNSPILLRSNHPCENDVTQQDSCEMFKLDPAGMPVGISPDLQIPSTTFRFETGDVFVAYTDGITEAENRHGELWGEQRLETLLRACCRQTPAQIISSILDEVSAFTNGQPQRDDMTLVVMAAHGGCEVQA
jgi:serine phosphatase RsbU (regulator of sigma subunit)/DNA-binding GntR family transcriptional regulator